MARFIGDSDKMQLDDIDHEEISKNLCVICKVDMGPNNPRQLCRKTYCENEDDNKLCENMDCERFPPDWDFEEDTEEDYEGGQWQKCSICIGYFDDNGMGDILYIEEEPNNREAGCSLCGKDKNIVQMKGTGQYICGNACDENEEDDVCSEDGACDTHLKTPTIVKQDDNGNYNVTIAPPLDDTEYHVYNLKNAYKKTIYQNEQWTTTLKNGKPLLYEIQTNFYWGSCEVECTEKDKDELLKKNELVFNDITGCSMGELNSGCDVDGILANEDNYTEEEKNEIHHLLYFDEDDKESYDPECDDGVDVCILEANGWSMDDTIYGIDSGGCTLELISD